MIYAGTFSAPEATFRFNRGDPMQKREPIAPAALSQFGAGMHLAADAPEKNRRMALARWIAEPKNPLTARVIVNRLWQYHFGTGLVDTPSDFGRNGSKPSHPELLDYLASEFVRAGWSIKAMHRLILRSAVYRQASAPRDDLASRDPDNRLLGHFPLRRSLQIGPQLFHRRLDRNSVPGAQGFQLLAHGRWHWGFHSTLRADSSDQPLRQHALQRGRNQERFHAHVHEPRHRPG